MICLFPEIYWNVDEIILKQYWRVLYSDFEEMSPNKFFSPIYFQLNHWKNGKCNSSSEEHLRNPKTNKGSYLDIELFILFKKFEFNFLTKSL
jgi:hypothetical protein